MWPLVRYASNLQLSGDGVLSLYNTHSGELLTTRYRNADGTYNAATLQRIDHLLRCRQSQKSVEVPVPLLELVDRIQDHFGSEKTVQVISGYRSPTLNETLRRTGHKVAKHSLHMQGYAMDIRIPGVATAELRKYALSLQAGGVGFYPANQFVHVDIGRVRRW